MRAVHLVNMALYGGLLAGSLAAYPGLPARVPAHFDAHGQVTRWTASASMTWFLPVAVALGCAGLLYAVPLVVRRWPRIISIPRRDEFLALPAERKDPVIRLLGQAMYGSALALGLLFCGLQFWTWRTAMNGTPPAAGPGFFLAIFGLGLAPAVLALALLVRLNGALDRALRSG